MRAKATRKKPRVSFNRFCGKNHTGVRLTWVWAKFWRPWAKLRKQRNNLKKRSRTASRPRSLSTLWQVFVFPGLVWRRRHQFHRFPAALSRRSRDPSQSRPGSGQAWQAREAKAHYAEAVRLQPKLAEAHFCLGLELGQDGDAAGAAAQFAEAVRLKPELIEARLNLGIALSNQHLDQQALDQFEEVLRRDPKIRSPSRVPGAFAPISPPRRRIAESRTSFFRD
jgi:hypothetical protein